MDIYGWVGGIVDIEPRTFRHPVLCLSRVLGNIKTGVETLDMSWYLLKDLVLKLSSVIMTSFRNIWVKMSPE